MKPVVFRPASDYSLAWLADLYTQTFADYYYQAIVTEANMADFVLVEQLDLDFSPVMFVGDEAVGLATVGLRGDRAYCKGFGVIVPFRGQGLARRLSEEVIRQARLAGARSIILGVLKHNQPAVRTYLGSGYRIWREHVSFEWRQPHQETKLHAPVGLPNPTAAGGGPPAGAAPLPSDSTTSRSEPIVDADPKVLLEHHAALHTVRPIWHREPASLHVMHNLHGMALVEDGRPRAYLIIQSASPDLGEIVDVGALGVEDAVALLTAAQQRYQRIISGNEPLDAPYCQAFAATGFRVTLERFGMIKDL